MPVHAVFAVLAAAVVWLCASGEWLPALLPLAYLLLPRLYVWKVGRDGAGLVDELSVPGALLPKERFWARVSIVLWAVFALGAAVMTVFGF